MNGFLACNKTPIEFPPFKRCSGQMTKWHEMASSRDMKLRRCRSTPCCRFERATRRLFTSLNSLISSAFCTSWLLGYARLSRSRFLDRQVYSRSIFECATRHQFIKATFFAHSRSWNLRPFENF